MIHVSTPSFPGYDMTRKAIGKSLYVRFGR
jgi:hypothetical protein